MRLDELLRAMGSLGPETAEPDVRTVAATYRMVRAEYLQEHAKQADGRVDISAAGRAWMNAVWTTPAWRKFAAAFKRYDKTDLIDWEFSAYRCRVIELLGAITRESSQKAMTQANGTYRRYREEYEHACARHGGAPGQATRENQSIWSTPEWARYHVERTRRWHTSPEGKEKRRAYAKKHYEERGKTERSTPEAKAKLAAQRRARYAKKKLTAQGSSSSP